MTPSVLFARADSVYKSLVSDVYDVERDARTFTGGPPVVAHPPCRAWSAMRGFAKPPPGEKDLALFAVHHVRLNGGVLEHPAFSTLWRAACLPLPGKGEDACGGWTLPVDQMWWGHRAQKRTWLYIVGCEPRDVPPLPFAMGEATHVCSIFYGTPKHRRRPCLSPAEREATPPAFAAWLLELASRCARTQGISPVAAAES